MRTEQDGPRDDLRRRLYRPGATDQDVERYRAAAEPDPETPATDAPAARPASARRRLLLLVAVVAVAGAASGIVLAGRAAAPAPAARSAAPAPAGEGTLVIPRSARAGFVRALEAGSGAGLQSFLYAHPQSGPASISSATRADSREYTGTGSDTIVLDPSRLAARGGRVTVLVVLDRGSGYTWRATRAAPQTDRSWPDHAVAGDAGDLGAGDVATSTTAYDDVPRRLQLLVGEQVRWGVLVVFTD